MSEVVLRDWRAADEAAVEVLWQRVFGTARGGQTVGWLFREGPAGPAVRAVAELDGRVVAHAGAAPMRFRLGEEVVRGGYSVGAMTAPEMQGQGLFVKLGRFLYARMESLGFAFVAGFSNQNSHRLMTGPLGRSAIRPFPWCVRPLLPGPRRPAGDPAPREAGGVRVEGIEPGDARLDALWDAARASVRVGAVRDAAFGSWRYATRPDAGYRVWLGSHGGRPAGALVLRLLDVKGLRFGFVVDALVAPDATAAGRALLRTAAAATRGAGGVALSALLPPAGPTRAALRRFGFVRVPEPLHPQVIRFSVRGLGAHAGCADLVDPSAWLLSWADTDVV